MAVVVPIVSACRSWTSPARDHKLEKGTSYWLDYDATRRGAFIAVSAEGVPVMLSEPAPDAAVALTHEYLGKLDYQGASAEAEAKIAEEIIQLGKRTSTIMFLRESLYRLGELAHANKLDDKTVALYEKAMQAALDLAKAEADQARAAAADAEARQMEKLQQLKELGLTDEQLEDLLP